MDILFKNDDFVFSYRVGGILKHNGKILLQRPKNDDYAIIGGHVAAMETSMETLKREFEEELHAKIEVDNLLAIGEIYFPWGKRPCHQICLYYNVHLMDDNIPLDGVFHGYDELDNERIDLDFCWVSLEDLKKGTKVCLALGISTFVMLSTESILSISFTSSLSRYGGDLAVGAMTIITSVSQLATLPLQGICQGGQPIMSYNYGAGNRNRVKKAFFTQFTVCTIFTGCFWLIMLLFPKMFAGIFSTNTELITYTAWALRIYMAGIFSLGFQVACQQSFMALGQAKVSLLLACLRKLILLIPLIFILPHFIQNKVFAVFLAEPISDILAAIITTSTFFSQFNKILDRK